MSLPLFLSKCRDNQICVRRTRTRPLCRKCSQREFLNNNHLSVHPSSMHQQINIHSVDSTPAAPMQGRGETSGSGIGDEMVVREPPDCDVQRPPTRPTRPSVSASVRLELAVRLKSALKLGAMETERALRSAPHSFFAGHPIECAAPLFLWLGTMAQRICLPSAAVRAHSWALPNLVNLRLAGLLLRRESPCTS